MCPKMVQGGLKWGWGEQARASRKRGLALGPTPNSITMAIKLNSNRYWRAQTFKPPLDAILV